MSRNSSRNVAPVKVKKGNDKDLTVIILAAGIGYRMKSYGVRSLIPINESQCLLQRQIELIYSRYPKADILVVVGFEAERLMNKFPTLSKYVENEKHETTSIARSIGIGLRATLSNRILLIQGDVLFNEHAIDTIAGRESAVVVDNYSHFADDEVGVVLDNNEVHNFAYGLPVKWGQIVFLTDKELALCKNIVFNKMYHQNTCHEILNLIIQRGGHFKFVSNPNAKFVEMDASKDIARAKQL